MKIPLKPYHFKRYADIARLLIKYGRSDVVSEFGLDQAFDGKAEARESANHAKPEDLADDLEKLGPTFVKLGQILSSRADLLPERFLKALSRLQDRVKPFPFAEVEKAVMTELGVRISKAFSSFDREPLAAASLGQVHRAALRDGRQVVVKAQRPDIRPLIAEDMDALEELARLAAHTSIGRRYQIAQIFEEFRRTLLHELDYLREAQNMRTLSANLKEFARIQVPLPITDYTTRNLLTMDYIPGRKVTSLSAYARLEIDGTGLAEELFSAYLSQVLIDGFFHADPHPGNVFLTDDGRVALLDVGMVGRISPGMQAQLLKLLVALSEGNGDGVADIAMQMGEAAEDFNLAEFRRRIALLVAEQRDSTLGRMDVGRTILDLGKSAGENGLRVPTDLTLLGKTLLQLDEIGKTLDPDFNPGASIRRNVNAMVAKRLKKDLTPGHVLEGMIEMKEFLSALPGRMNRIMDTAAKGEIDVRVKSADANLLLAGFQKIANRIAAGLALAALIIAAALLAQAPSKFTLFGHPGLSVIFFVLATIGGAWLMCDIFLSDRSDRHKEEKR